MKRKRREADRREPVDEVVLEAAEVFLLPEQHLLASLDRRRGPRRKFDARRRIADQWRQMVALGNADVRRLVEEPPAQQRREMSSPREVELLEAPPAPALQDLFESDPPPMPKRTPSEPQRRPTPPTPPPPGRSTPA